MLYWIHSNLQFQDQIRGVLDQFWAVGFDKGFRGFEFEKNNGGLGLYGVFVYLFLKLWVFVTYSPWTLNQTKQVCQSFLILKALTIKVPIVPSKTIDIEMCIC